MNQQELIIKQQVRCVSHEIKNQLSITDLYCEIISKHLVKNNISIPAIDNALGCIKKSSQMIGNSLLDFKAINSFELKKCNLTVLLYQVIELAKVYAIDKEIEFIGQLEVTTCVTVDENKFMACVLNLIKNAIESIEKKGYVKTEFRVENNFVRLQISNNGEKIPADFVDKIFELGQTSKSYGSGVGLYICKQNILAMNGDLKLIKSTDDETVFEISLPC